MSLVKISQLPLISQINANTANTLFVGVDVPSLTTGRMTVTTLAAGLYSNNALIVGSNPINYSNVVAQFSGSDPLYTQVNLQNFNSGGSSDYVASTSDSDNLTKFVDMGIVGSTYNNTGATAYQPYDSYVYNVGYSNTSFSGNLIINAASSNANIIFVVGGLNANNIIAKITKTGFVLNTQSYLTFSDGTTQATAAASNAFTQAAYSLANTVASNLSANNTLQSNINSTQNTWISSNAVYSNAAYAFANTINTYAYSAYAFGNTVNTYAYSAYAYSNTINAYAFSAYAYSNTVNTYAFSAYAFANSVNTVQSGINSTQNTWISSNAVYSNAAYAQANIANGIAATALQNTTGVFAGSLTITGDVRANNHYANTIIFTNTNASISTPSQVGGPPKDINIIAGSDLGQNNGGTITITAGQTLATGKSGGNVVLVANGNNSVIQLTSNTVNLTGNLVANTLGTSVSVDNITSNSASFSKNVVVLGNLTANTLLGNIFFSNVVTTTSQSNSIIWYPQAALITQQVGQLFYYANTQSLILDTDIPGDRLSISKVLFFRGYNSTGATIPANSIVRLVPGVTSNQIPYIALADATTSANATVAGFVKNPIANGAYGFAYSQGIVEDLNSTSLGQNGDILFLSATPGLASNVAPTGANTVVQLGRIILSDTTQGKLFIQTQLRQAYGKPNGSVLYAYANNITSSNTISINDSTGMFTAKDITANTLTTSNGIINTVRVNSTSPLTINFTTDIIVRANLSANFTVTPASFVAGKAIDVWLTNTSSGGGANHTITHGVSALNSTVGATTFTLAGTQSAWLKYMCADGTLANTFVAITYQ
jgi:hypothetical protein